MICINLCLRLFLVRPFLLLQDIKLKRRLDWSTHLKHFSKAFFQERYLFCLILFLFFISSSVFVVVSIKVTAFLKSLMCSFVFMFDFTSLGYFNAINENSVVGKTHETSYFNQMKLEQLLKKDVKLSAHVGLACIQMQSFRSKTCTLKFRCSNFKDTENKLH